MIGVFDSGSGGLTVVRALRALAPKLDITYVADIANMPYGDKSKEELSRLTAQLVGFLRARGATTLVSACNSISASVIRPAFEVYGVRESDIIEMVAPAVEELSRRGLTQAAVLATPATVRSGMYEAAAAPGLLLQTFACSKLALRIEKDASESVIAMEIRKALTGIPAPLRTVLLGCTHYPIVKNLFDSVAEEMGQVREFIDPATAVAAAAIRQHGAEGSGRCTVLCTRSSDALDRHVGRLLGRGIKPAEVILL